MLGQINSAAQATNTPEVIDLPDLAVDIAVNRNQACALLSKGIEHVGVHPPRRLLLLN